MFLFGLYTVVVWWLAFEWRRRFLGVVSVVMGGLGLLGVHWLINAVSKEPSPVIDVLLVPYAALLLVVGMYIVILPRPKTPLSCKACAYDMAGHETADARCPECGLDDAAHRPHVRRRRPESVSASAAHHAVPDAQPEHHEGQAGDQDPRDAAPAIV